MLDRDRWRLAQRARGHAARPTTAISGAIVAAVVALVVAIAGCGGSDGDEQASSARSGDDFAGEELVVVNYGGTFSEAWNKHVIEPFEKKYNAKIVQEEGLTFDTLAKLRAQKGNPQIDVWMMADSGAVSAQQEGLTQPLDSAAIPNLEKLIPAARTDGDPYAEFLFASTVIAYNKDKVKTPPTSWDDLADPAYKGKLILPDINGCCGNLFLMNMARLHGGDIDNVEPGFEYIKRLKPNVLTFWSSHDQAASLLTSGQALIGVWSNDRSGTQALQGAPIGLVFPKDGVSLLGNAIGITKGTKHLELAQKYVNFALDAAQQKPVDENAVLMPTNGEVKLSDKLQQYIPPDDVVQNSLNPDWAKVAEYMPEWTKRWEREVTSK